MSISLIPEITKEEREYFEIRTMVKPYTRKEKLVKGHLRRVSKWEKEKLLSQA